MHSTSVVDVDYTLQLTRLASTLCMGRLAESKSRVEITRTVMSLYKPY